MVSSNIKDLMEVLKPLVKKYKKTELYGRIDLWEIIYLTQAGSMTLMKKVIVAIIRMLREIIFADIPERDKNQKTIYCLPGRMRS